MHYLERTVEGGRGVVTGMQGYVQHLLSRLQGKSGFGKSSSPDVLTEGNSCNVGEHPLEVVGGATCYSCHFLKGYFLIKVFFDVRNRLIELLHPLHLLDLLWSGV